MVGTTYGSYDDIEGLMVAIILDAPVFMPLDPRHPATVGRINVVWIVAERLEVLDVPNNDSP